MKVEMSAVEGWITKRFDEIGTIISGSTPSTTVRAFWNGEIVWVTPYDLSRLNTPYLKDSSKHITVKGLDGCSSHLLPAGSIVMSSRAPIGYVAIPTVDFCTNQGCKSIQLKDGFTSEFTYYNILFNIEKVKNLGEGTTFAEISKTALSKVELDFPSSKPEQTKIAEILSTVDRAIEQTEALIAKQQRIKTGLMQDLLTRGIDEHGNLRSERTHKFKDSSLGRIPVEWEITTLEELADAVDPQPDHRTPTEVSDGVPYVGVSDFNKDGRIDFDNARKVSVDAFKKQQRAFSVSEGDFVFGKIGTIGSPRRVPILPKFALSANVILLKPRETTSFIYWWMASPIIERLVELEIHTTSQPAFGIQKMRTLKIVKPTKEERKRIGQLLDELDVGGQRIAINLMKLRALKTALMQDLLTGKKRVSALMGASCVVKTGTRTA